MGLLWALARCLCWSHRIYSGSMINIEQVNYSLQISRAVLVTSSGLIWPNSLWMKDWLTGWMDEWISLVQSGPSRYLTDWPCWPSEWVLWHNNTAHWISVWSKRTIVTNWLIVPPWAPGSIYAHNGPVSLFKLIAHTHTRPIVIDWLIESFTSQPVSQVSSLLIQAVQAPYKGLLQIDLFVWWNHK